MDQDRLQQLLSAAPPQPRRGVCLTEEARRDPEEVLASWCGRKASRATIAGRPGWERVRAVVDDQLHEVKSAVILQPGPGGRSWKRS